MILPLHAILNELNFLLDRVRGVNYLHTPQTNTIQSTTIQHSLYSHGTHFPSICVSVGTFQSKHYYTYYTNNTHYTLLIIKHTKTLTSISLTQSPAQANFKPW